MSKIKAITAIFLIVTLMLVSLPSIYAEEVLTDNLFSLTLRYADTEEVFPNLSIEIYKIADLNSNGSYTYTNQFKNYPVNEQLLMTEHEWKVVAYTLSAYAEADMLEPTAKSLTNENGYVKFAELPAGMYMLMPNSVDDAQGCRYFEPSLFTLPYSNESGDSQNHLVASPKSEIRPIGSDSKLKKVTKQWDDLGYKELRPERIVIDILKDGELYTTQILSSKNEWTYSWTISNDSSIWQVVERQVPENYKVTVEENGDFFIITNTCVKTEESSPESDNPTQPQKPSSKPQTGDTMHMTRYVTVMCIAGFAIIITALLLKRRRS